MIFLFAGRDYYPRGGADDFVGVFLDQRSAAAELARDQRESYERWEWAHAAELREGALAIVKVWVRERAPWWDESYAQELWPT